MEDIQQDLGDWLRAPSGRLWAQGVWRREGAGEPLEVLSGVLSSSLRARGSGVVRDKAYSLGLGVSSMKGEQMNGA